MELKGFKKLSYEKQINTYGGWAWLATAAPLVMQLVLTAVSTYKMLSSDKGSVKYQGADSKWDNSSSSSKSSKTEHTFYAF